MIGNDGDALRPVRMMRAVGIVTGVVIVLALTYNIFFETGTWFNRKFIELAPKSVRTLYFDSVFLNADELCAGCRFRVINALDMIERDLNNSANSYEYDYERILPFIRSDSHGGFEEPISNTACAIILRYNDRNLFLKMAAMYETSPGVLRQCLHSGLFWVKASSPATHSLISDNIGTIPALSPFLRDIPESMQIPDEADIAASRAIDRAKAR